MQVNNNNVIGIVHSIESLSGVDGDGIRSVVFMQGCNVNCSFCHNADTFKIYKTLKICDKENNNINNAQIKSDNYDCTIKSFLPQELASKLLKFKPYYNKLGGVTFSGGECLLQAEFVTSTAKILVDNGINVYIETSGALINNEVENLLKLVSCVILDVKFCTNELYIDNTNINLDTVISFLELLNTLNVKTLVRSVIINGLTNTMEHLQFLASIKNKYKCIYDVKLLNYHNLGEKKFNKIGIPYKLKDVKLLCHNDFAKIESELIDLLKKN